MGEFASFNGQRIKIGTCENMYYLRADQASRVSPLSGNVDPATDDGIRFPWPDEDSIEPGAFENYDRGFGLYGVTVPEGVDHHSVQFTAPGYVVSLACPEAENGPASDHGLNIGRNGHPGPVRIVQQRWFEGRLVTVCACGGCGARYRLPTIADAQPVIDAVREAARVYPDRRDWLTTIADRIAAGYEMKRGA